MSWIAASGWLAALVFAAPVDAGTVTYATTSSQLCVGAAGCGVTSQTLGGAVTVSYTPVASTVVDASSETFSSFGTIAISCVGSATACANQSLAGLNLYINIAQTAPNAGSASISGGAIIGSIRGTASTASITWAASSGVAIGPIRYAIANNALALVPPATNGGRTSIQAVISDRTLVFGTAASQLCFGAAGFGVSEQTLGNVRVRFEPVTATRIEADSRSFASFGRIVVSCVAGGFTCGSTSLAGLNLYINISQTAPTSGSVSLGPAAFTNPGGMAGTLSGTASTARLQWSGSASAAVGPHVYVVANNSLALVPPATNGGTTSIQALIVRDPVFANGFE
jgi:hypothetical protein